MPYQATVYRIMIASPSDVVTERRVAVDVIHEWNAIHSQDRQIVLAPVGWETHVTPAMGDRPQAVISRQVLRDADVLVAIFWTRLGTPTGVSPSGTVEEIEEHLTTGKPAMIYFSSAPVRLDSVDDEQYRALLDFKETCRRRGLVGEYDSVGDFRAKFARQLAQTVIREFSKDEAEQEGPPEDPAQREAPPLSDAARELLIEATNDRSGTILCLASFGGLHVETNGKNFVEKGNPRSEAQWRGAVSGLAELGLIEDRGYKGEVFAVTDAGYRVADLLR